MSSKNKRANQNQSGQIRPAILTAIRLFALAAMAASAYLAYVSMSGGAAIGCGPDSDCDKVLQSRWAYWFNVPVSVFALMTYSLLIGASFRLGPSNEPAVQRKAWAWMVACALILLGGATWFLGLMFFSLKAVCPYCLVSHLCGATAAVLTLVNAPLRHPSAKPWELEKMVFVAPRTIRRVTIIAVTALALLIAGQVQYQRPTMVVQRAGGATNVSVAAPSMSVTSAVPSNAPLTSPAIPTAVPSPPPAPAAVRMFPLYGGQFQLNILELPVMGAPTNRHVVVSLFDYTCHHCRAMHPLLVEAAQTFSNELVIVSLPMPLDPTCNHTLQRAAPSHTNACNYARLSLAVWRADRTKHHEFDDWLMTGNKPPPLDAAQQKAIALVGVESFNKAFQDPWIEQQLKLDVAIYEVAYRAGQGRMPQLVVGPNVALGIYTKPELFKLLSDTLGLKPPP